MKEINLRDHTYYSHILPIDQKRGLGFEFISSGKRYITTGDINKDLPTHREARLSISTYGVAHYYGKLKININNTDINNSSRSISGFLGKGVAIPDECKSLDIELLRLVTEEDKSDDPRRWEDYDIGDKTNAFYLEEDIIELIRNLATLIFKGKWVIIIDGYRKDRQEIIVNN